MMTDILAGSESLIHPYPRDPPHSTQGGPHANVL